MTALRLVAAMLRYRVASLLAAFFVLGPAVHGELATFRWGYVFGVLALFASYVVATSLNDIVDVEIDRINVRDRPLVTGLAKPRQVGLLAGIAAAMALLLSTLVGPAAIIVIGLSLLINAAYSLPPIRLSVRPLATAPVLAIAYVAVPYALGLTTIGAALTALDVRVEGGLVLLFAGRMLLKDFRDRRGDAAFGKRTFLLVYGKHVTVLAVLACVIAGDALLLTVLPRNMTLILVIESYFAAIVFELHRLWKEDSLDHIARGARMGNAVVLTWLGYALLESSSAPAAELGVFAAALAGVYWLAFLLPAPASAASATAT